MPYNPEVHHRQSIRLRDYDYSRAGVSGVMVIEHLDPVRGQRN